MEIALELIGFFLPLLKCGNECQIMAKGGTFELNVH